MEKYNPKYKYDPENENMKDRYFNWIEQTDIFNGDYKMFLKLYYW